MPVADLNHGSPRALALLLVLSMLPCPVASTAEPPLPSLAVTNGLIRWWPNPMDGHEEVSGTEGTIIGLIPPDGHELEPYDFNYRPGWLDAGPGITNRSFTLVLWMQSMPLYSVNFLLEQAEGMERAWSLRWILHGRAEYVFEEGNNETDLRLGMPDPQRAWTHVAITRAEDGTKTLYQDGMPLVSTPGGRPYNPKAGTLSIGCNLAGDRQWRGNLNDVALYDRVLTPGEISRLAALRTERRPRETECRRKAAGRFLPHEAAEMPDVWSEDLFQHRRFTSDDGLPGNEVKCLLHASDGHLWVGTSAGLARFDGTRFLSFTPENTPSMRITGPDIRSLAEGADRVIWAGTFGGLLRLDQLGVTSITNALPELLIMRVEPASDGTLWLACLHNGDRRRGACWIVKYDPRTQAVLARTRAPNQVHELRDSRDGLWLQTESELLLWDGHSSLPEFLLRHWQPAQQPTLGSTRLARQAREVIYSLKEPRRGPFLETLGTGFPGSACWTVDRIGQNRTGKRMGGPVVDWQGTRDGLFQRGPDGWRRILLGADKLPREVLTLTPNREGGVWFGTWDADGLHLLTPREARTFSVAQGLPDPETSSIVGTPQGGVLIGTMQGYYTLPENTIHTSIPLRSEANILLTNGLVLGLSVSAQPSPLHGAHGDSYCNVALPLHGQLHRASGLLLDRDGWVWISSGNGIAALSPKGLDSMQEVLSLGDDMEFRLESENVRYFRPGEHGLPDHDFLGACQTRDGSIWFGTMREGLFRFWNGEFSAFPSNASFVGTEIVPRHEDLQGGLWIVSTEGLYCASQGKLTRFTTADGLKENLVLDFAEDPQGNFWLPGATGVHRVSGESLRKRLAGGTNTLDVITLGARDGMISPQCTRLGWPRTLMTAEGILWVPTGNGAVSIDTRHIRTDSSAPQVVITEILTAAGPLYGPSYGKGNLASELGPAESSWGGRGTDLGLRVPADGVRALQFQFATLSFGNSQDRPLRYRLLGRDKDWSNPGPITTASYTALDPGRYTFEVQAANRYGRWTDSVTRFNIEIQPHLYERGWFQGLAAAGLLGMAGGEIARRLRNERRFARLREEQHLVAERARIARDMHDELGAGLTQLSLLQNQPATSGAKARQLLRVLDEIVWTINPRKDTLEATASYLTSWAEEFLTDTHISLELDIPMDTGEISVSSEWRHELLLCAKEALNNIVKHAQATNVKLSLEVNASDVLLRIADDGRGMAASHTTAPSRSGGGGNGLRNLRERVTRMGGDLVIQSAAGQGTVVQLRLPIQREDR